MILRDLCARLEYLRLAPSHEWTRIDRAILLRIAETAAEWADACDRAGGAPGWKERRDAAESALLRAVRGE